MTPNAYKENIDLFKIKRNSWLVINLGGIYLVLIFLFLFLFMVFFKYYLIFLSVSFC